MTEAAHDVLSQQSIDRSTTERRSLIVIAEGDPTQRCDASATNVHAWKYFQDGKSQASFHGKSFTDCSGTRHEGGRVVVVHVHIS